MRDLDLSTVEEYRDMRNCSQAEAELVMGHTWPAYIHPPADRDKRLVAYGFIRPHTVSVTTLDGFTGRQRVWEYTRGYWETAVRRMRPYAAPRAVEGEEG